MYKIRVPKPQDDFIFKLKDLDFHADIIWFTCFSEKFQNDISLIEKKEYTVESDVSKESFQDFLDACQGKAFFIKTSNVFDLNLLCNEFKISSFIDKVKTFYDQHTDEALIKKMQYIVLDESSSQNENTIKLIAAEISPRLDHMTEELRTELFDMKLTSKIIYQFLTIPNRQFQFDNLIFQNINRYGYDDEEDLFSLIDLRALSMDDVLKFSQSNNLPEKYDSKRVFPFLKELIEKIKAQKKKIDELRNDSLNAINNLNNRINEIEESTARIRNDIGSFNDDIRSIQKDCDLFIAETEVINEKLQKIDQKMINLDTGMLYPIELRFNQIENQIKHSLILNNPFDGIFHRLYIRNDINPAGKDVFINTPSSINPDFKPSNLLEFDDDKIDDCYYHKLPDKNSNASSSELINKNESNCNNWIEFDFTNDFAVKIIGYTIRTNSFGETFSHPKHFKIQGQNENSEWVTIDEKKNAIELNGAQKVHTYFLLKYSDCYQKIRFLQLDSHFQYKDKDKILALSAIELHGEREYVQNDVNTNDNYNND